MRYRIKIGPMLIDGIIREPGDVVEVDDARAEAWAARLEPADVVEEPADVVEEPADVVEEPEQPETPETAPPEALPAVEGDDSVEVTEAPSAARKTPRRRRTG